MDVYWLADRLNKTVEELKDMPLNELQGWGQYIAKVSKPAEKPMVDLSDLSNDQLGAVFG
jgi:hypothetical protein